MRIHANGKSWCRTPAKPTVPSYPTSTKQTNTTNQPFSPKGSQDLQGSLLLVLAIARAKDASPRAKSCTCIECLEKYSDTPVSQDLNGHSVFALSMYRTHLCLLFWGACTYFCRRANQSMNTDLLSDDDSFLHENLKYFDMGMTTKHPITFLLAVFCRGTPKRLSTFKAT